MADSLVVWVTKPVTPHQPDCAKKVGKKKRKAYQCGGTFRCPHCKRRVGWCMGCYDNMPEACDDCWKPLPEEIENTCT